MMDAFIRDLRFAFRLIRKAPILSTATIVTLALGIGLNGGVFTILNGMLFRPRVTADPDSFVHLQAVYSGSAAPRSEGAQLTTEDYTALQQRVTSIRGLTAWSVMHARFGPESVDVMPLLVSCSFFDTYGLDHLERGRTFTAEECGVPGAPVAVISDEFWTRQFASDPDIVGKPLLLNRQPFVIVGVAPAGFPGRVRGEGIWIPYANQPALLRGISRLDDPRTAWLWVEGRLKPGVGRAAAQAELNVLIRQQDALTPGKTTAIALTNGALVHEAESLAVIVVPLVLGSVGLVLFMACGNVTLLLLSRAVARRREIAVRLALGCGRARLLRMLLTESVLFAVLGVPLSAWIAWEVPQALRAMIPSMPFYPMQPDVTVFSYLAAASLTAGLAAGLTPAIESLRQRLAPALGAQDSLFGGGPTRSRNILIAAQVGMSVVLLAGMALFLRVERTLAAPDPSVDAAHVMVASYDPPVGSSSADTLRLTTERLASLPGVQAVAYARGASAESRADTVVVTVRGDQAAAPRRVAVNSVSARYFETMNRRIVEGRALQADDARAGAGRLVISEPLARAWWPRGGAIGAMVETPDRRAYEVVGIVHGDLPLAGGASDPMQVYTLAAANPPGGLLLLRFSGSATALQTAVRGALQDLGPASSAMPTTLAAADAAFADRLLPIVDMVATLGATAILLALVGLYGVVSFAVERRTREIGVRMALGATRGDIMRLILATGVRPVAAGLASGFVLVIPGAIALSRIFQNTPVPLRAGDPVPYFLVAVTLALSALATMIVPARRAAALAPSISLRSE
jgi:predicted permease